MAKRIDRVIAILKKATRDYEIPIIAAARDKYHSDFHILVTVMLTAQTRDALVAKMMPSIFRVIKSPKDLQSLTIAELEKLIFPVSFYHTKARNLKRLGSILIEKYAGSVPRNFHELIELPGVGEKTAHIVLHRTVSSKHGIGVDTHVHRISNRLGFIKTKTPPQSERALQKVLASKYWPDYNHLLVKWGQNICTPISPRCSECALRQWCPRIGVKSSR